MPRVPYLRIVFTILCGIVSVLVCVLWLQSYSTVEIWNVLGHNVISAQGSVIIDETWVRSDQIAPVDAGRDGGTANWGQPHFAYVTAGTGWTVSYWIPTLVSLTLAALPWLPRRYSLRTLMLATAVMAAFLGLITYNFH